MMMKRVEERNENENDGPILGERNMKMGHKKVSGESRTVDSSMENK
jgi:hypothetical protein